VSAVGIGILLRVIGKIIGITLGAWLGVRASGISSELSLRDYLKVSVLGGIGFTVSFLVTDLVFAKGSIEHSQAVMASLLAALVSVVLAILVFGFRARPLT
jgi:NhaA family Na+:H+ antiporter